MHQVYHEKVMKLATSEARMAPRTRTSRIGIPKLLAVGYEPLEPETVPDEAS